MPQRPYAKDPQGHQVARAVLGADPCLASKDSEKMVTVPMLLPHELIRCIVIRGNKNKILEEQGYSADALKHLNETKAKLGVTELLGLGLWLDGTPCNWDRTKSVETVAMSFPGQTGELGNIRLPIAAMMKHHLIKRASIDALLEVVAWSLKCCIEEVMPHSRHDGQPWLKSDLQRSRLQGKSIGLKAIMTEVRADWQCLKLTFGFPGWRENRGCCFRCKVVPANIRQCSRNAGWRAPNMRHTHWSLMAKMAEEKQKKSPVFSCPFLTAHQMVIDWLHCCDLGVAQDFLGNLFLHLLPLFPGNSNDARVKELYLTIVDFYSRSNSESKLDDLTFTMIRKSASSCPKLRSKAGESRALVPFAAEIAQTMLTGPDSMTSTIKECAILLNECYNCLTRASFSHEALQTSCRKFCILYCALGDYVGDGYSWQFKPKFHLWQELCEESTSCPASCWTYRDEDFGGSVAKLAHRRGGQATAATAGLLVLQKFRARRSLPRVL